MVKAALRAMDMTEIIAQKEFDYNIVELKKLRVEILNEKYIFYKISKFSANFKI